MKYLLMIYGNREKWESMPPEAWPEAIARQEAFNARYRDTGELLGAFGLADAARAKLFGESPAEAVTPGHPLSAAINTALASLGTISNVVPDLALLRDRVDAAWASWQTSQHRYSQTGPLLPGLISDVETATRALRHSDDAAQRRGAHRIAADLYFLLRTFTKRIGRTDLSLLVADRGLRAAEDADDPLRIAAARWNLGQVLLTTGEPEVAEEVTIEAAEELRPGPDDDHDRAALYGALWLVAAIAAARSGDGWAARERLRQYAWPAASRSGEGNILWAVFGPVNVSLHAVSIGMETGEAAEALRLADNIDASGCPSIERRATFALDLGALLRPAPRRCRSPLVPAIRRAGITRGPALQPALP